jgi:hypothetical protein
MIVACMRAFLGLPSRQGSNNGRDRPGWAS